MKDGFTCFRPISEMASRCVSRFSESTETVPEDGPLLKHRPSAGFSTRQARDAAESTAKCAQSFGSQLVRSSRNASRRLRRRAQDVARNIPTPTRSRPNARRESYESSEGAESRSFFADDDIFSIGSDDEICSEDEEEQMWHTHPLEASPGQLDEALTTWGRPGDPKDQVGKLDFQAVSLNLSPPSKVGAPNAFYVGTPRDCM